MHPAVRLLLASLGFLALAATASAAELERRAFLGIAMTEPADPSLKGQGALIQRVVPGSSAEKAGLKREDVLTRINGKAVRATADVVSIMRASRAGHSMHLSIVRNGQPLELDTTLVGLPLETAEDYDTIYEAVEADGALRRVILTRPRGSGPHPAVLFVGGIGCYSMDYPLDVKANYRQLLASLTRQGFMTMRVEKSGMGDSEGEPCARVDMQTEVRGYVAGLKALKAKAGVDADKVFIVGHSIGGIVGPLVASEVPVRGIAVIGTIGSTWFEYELVNRRRQLKLEGIEPRKIGARMQLKQWCMHRLLIEREPRQQILEKRPECAEEMEIPSPDAYLQQIAAVDLPDLWSRLKLDTLLVYGSADFLTSAEEHREIAYVLNAERPGAATFVEMPDMDHSFYRMKDQRESFRRRRAGEAGEYHPELGRTIGEWLRIKAGRV